MTDDDKDLEELFAPLRETARDPVDHPTPEELDAYHAKELSSEEEERIREHLVACRECADLVLDLQAFSVAARQPDTGVVDFEQAAAWRDLREKLPFRPEPGTEPVKTIPRRRGFFAPLRSARGIAAVLAVAVVSGVLVYQLREPVKVQEVTVDPWGSFRGGEGESQTISLPAKIWLRVPPDDSSPDYRADLYQGEQKVETISDLRKDDLSNVLLELPSGCLEPGEYEIRLAGLEDGQERVIETYRILIMD